MGCMTPQEHNAMMKDLRDGKKVKCPLCKDGYMEAIGDHKITHCFQCNHCRKRLNIN